MVVDAFNLSTDLGVSGLLDAPEMRDAIGRLEKVILEADIPLGTYALSPEQTRALLDKGYRLPVHGVDVLMICRVGPPNGRVAITRGRLGGAELRAMPILLTTRAGRLGT